MYTGLQKGMSIVSIITLDIIEKILNFYYNPYIANMTIDDSLHPFLQSSVQCYNAISHINSFQTLQPGYLPKISYKHTYCHPFNYIHSKMKSHSCNSNGYSEPTVQQ